MKKIILISVIAALAGVLFTSCSNNEHDGRQTPPPPEGEAFFSFGLYTDSSVNTRATEVGSDAETKVNDVTILLYSQANGILTYRFDLDAEGGAGAVFNGTDVATGAHLPQAASTDRFISVARQIIKQDYYMIVMANVKELGIDNKITVGSTYMYEIIRDGVVDISNVEEYIENGFFMSNANGPVPVPASSLATSQQAAEASPTRVKIDRIVAKVKVSKNFPDEYIVDGDQVTTVHGSIIKNLKFGIDKQNEITYLVRQYANFADATAGNNESYAGTMETYLTSFNADRKWMYATTPYFDSIYGDALTVIDVFDENSDRMFVIPDKSEGPREQYISENTRSLTVQSSDDYLNAFTNVVVTATVIPENYSEGDSYYSFTNTLGEPKIFSHEEGCQWLYVGFPAEMDGLQEMMEDSQFNFSYPPSPEPTEFMTSNGITFHPKGFNVFRIPIKHFAEPSNSTATDPRKEIYGHYGIVRNNVYSIVITAINGPGVGVYSFISADIEVNEWYVRDEQEEEL